MYSLMFLKLCKRDCKNFVFIVIAISNAAKVAFSKLGCKIIVSCKVYLNLFRHEFTRFHVTHATHCDKNNNLTVAHKKIP